MSEEDALLAAIAAHPDEDTPRLAYADWLDEHGRHARAEFIRIQIDIAAYKETLPRVLQNRYVDVWKRNQELIDTRRVEFLGPLAALPDTERIEFRRGFLSELSLDAERFLQHADHIASLKPQPEVAVRDAGHWILQGRLGDATSASVVTSLRMQSDRRPGPVTLAPTDLQTWLSESGPWPRLRELDLSYCAIGDDGLRELVYDHEAHFPVLTHLDLSGNGLTDDGVVSLVNSDLWPPLQELVLGGNPIGDLAATTLAEAPRSNLTHLNLRFTAIGQPGQQVLLRRFGGRLTLF